MQEKWIDEFNLENSNTPGKPRHVSGFYSIGMVSTIWGFDTEEWETMFVTPKEEYFKLETYKSEEEALEGHKKWAKKVKEGYIPTHSLVDNFTMEACLKFLFKMREKNKGY